MLSLREREESGVESREVGDLTKGSSWSRASSSSCLSSLLRQMEDQSKEKMFYKTNLLCVILLLVTIAVKHTLDEYDSTGVLADGVQVVSN